MIVFENVSKTYKNKKILENINLEIKKNTITTLIGESGCGKTTTLKMINRLVEPTTGTIKINGKDIKKEDVIKLRRSMGYVIQQTGLFPHMTIRENIELIYRLENKNQKEISERTLKMMEMIGLDADEYLDRYPSELSGGQQQRIGIARAFETDPDIILMDEPFSALDPVTRVSLQDELMHLQEIYKKTIIFVTHDMDEAIKISDKIAIMDKGRIIQYDKPEKILKNPVNDFVRNFVGKKRIWTSPEFIKVKDIMIENPLTCSSEYSIFYCLNKMKMNSVDSLMVVDKNKKLKGILYAENLNNINYSKLKAKDLIADDFLYVHPEDSIIDLLKLIDSNKGTTLPVVDKNMILKGLITRGKLITELSQQFIDEEE